MMIKADGLPIAHSNSVPNIYDLDGDSIKDLVLSNTSGYIYFYKNMGTNANPYFEAAYETLKTVSETYIDAYANSRSHFVDWTGDGDLDLLLGGAEGYVWLCENSTITTINEMNTTPSRDDIFKVITNPAKNKVNIKYNLKNPGSVLIRVFDITGQKIATVLQQMQHSGDHSIVWNNSGRCGLYFVNFKTESYNITKKVILLK